MNIRRSGRYPISSGMRPPVLSKLPREPRSCPGTISWILCSPIVRPPGGYVALYMYTRSLCGRGFLRSPSSGLAATSLCEMTALFRALRNVRCRFSTESLSFDDAGMVLIREAFSEEHRSEEHTSEL